MYSRVINTLDFPLSYRMMSVLIYIFYLSRVILSTKEGMTPIIPNLIFTLFCNLLMFVLTMISQEKQSFYYDNRMLIKRIILASIPPILGIKILITWIKKQREQGTEFTVYAGGILILIVLSILSIQSILLLILIFILGDIAGHGFYLLSLGMWGIIGITIADMKVFRGSKENKRINKLIQYMVKLYLTLNRRIILILTILVIMIVLSIITDTHNVTPVSW